MYTRREFNHDDDLLVGQMEPLHNLADRGAHFQIIEHHGNRRSFVAEDPSATSLAGNTFHSGALSATATDGNTVSRWELGITLKS
jgi:hypothetical protein